MILGIDHIGVVVEDLDAVHEAFEILLEQPGRREEIAGAGIRAASFEVGGIGLELIRFDKAVEGVDPSVCRPPPGGGPQHLAFRVSDLNASIEKLARHGVHPLVGFPRQGLHGRIAFFREPVTGMLLELVEGHALPLDEGG
jgi:hypothetical protein